jgi:hypothetical protein
MVDSAVIPFADIAGKRAILSRIGICVRKGGLAIDLSLLEMCGVCHRGATHAETISMELQHLQRWLWALDNMARDSEIIIVAFERGANA